MIFHSSEHENVTAWHLSTIYVIRVIPNCICSSTSLIISNVRYTVSEDVPYHTIHICCRLSFSESRIQRSPADNINYSGLFVNTRFTKSKPLAPAHPRQENKAKDSPVVHDKDSICPSPIQLYAD